MGLYEEYKESHTNDVLVSTISKSMYPAILDWLNQSMQWVPDQYAAAVLIKNKFRIDIDIPRSLPGSYSGLSDLDRLIYFLYYIAQSDSQSFFVIIDYMFKQYLQLEISADGLEALLRDAGYMYAVKRINTATEIVKRISEEEFNLMKPLLANEITYASEFHDAFTELYGTKPDPTKSAGESFQAVESALKKYLGSDKGNNLGAIYGWLDTHPEEWKYNAPSDNQDDANKQFLSLLNFINKSYRKVKHGQADTKLTVSKLHAEVILRATALIIYELENTIEFS